MEASGPERRRTKRYAEQLVVQWQRQTAPDAPPGEQQWRYAFIRDISKGGVCFETNETLAKSDLLYFKIKIHFSLWPFTCTGQVLRVLSKKPGTHEIGIAFLNIDPKDADLIDLLAWEQEQKKGGGS